jgi:hypothetical protein
MDADNMPPMGDLDRDDTVTKAMGDIDDDGDHDMDDHKAEKEGPGPDGSAEHEGPEGEEPEPEEEKKKDEDYGNSVAGGADTEYKDINHMVNNLAGGMNKPKQMYQHSYRQGDNPMAMPESKDALKASIRAELQQRLAEAKGVK